MVSKKQAVPCFSLKLLLPLDHGLFERLEIISGCSPFAKLRMLGSVLHMLELENHVQLTAIFSCIFLCLFYGDTGCFPNCHDIIFRKNFTVHFLKEFVNPWSMNTVRAEISIKTAANLSIREGLVLGNHADHVHAEAVDSFVAPEFHHVINFLTDLFVFPVQIRLFFGKKVKIIHLGLRIVFPCGTGEAASPVVRLFSVYRIFPDVVVPVWIVFGLFAFQEPLVLIRGMVYHQIHQHLDFTPVRFLKKLFIVVHSSVVLVNSAVIGNVVAIVILRRLQHRGNPQNINAKLFQVIQFFYNSVDISDSVPIAVVKAFGINLIYNAFFPPVFFHTKQFLSVLFFSIYIR